MDNSGRGQLIVLAAPSGAGKTTLVRALLERLPQLAFSVSYTTRAPRPSERPGVDYVFVSEAEFERKAKAGQFLEHARVFDHRYGTGKADVNALLEAGVSVLLEIDWQGARQVKRQAPEAVTIFVLPPSLAELERRLRGRATDAEATIQRRLRDAAGDVGHWREFDFAVINDDVATAAEALVRIVRGQGGRHATATPGLKARVAEILAGPAR